MTDLYKHGAIWNYNDGRKNNQIYSEKKPSTSNSPKTEPTKTSLRSKPRIRVTDCPPTT